MVERQIVDLAAVGSNPIVHPCENIYKLKPRPKK